MKQGSTFGGALLIAGMTIGAGMLALPVITGAAGLIPSIAIMIVCWAASLFTGLLFLEVNLVFDRPVNFITMAQKTLGSAGKGIAWGAYLLLLYNLTGAYLAGSRAFTDFSFGPFIFLILLGSLVIFATKIIDYVNRLLMVGLLFSYVVMLFLGSPYIKKELLIYQNWGALWMATPIIVAAFGFQIIIPSLTTYLQRDVKRIKRALIMGSGAALFVYLLFQVSMLGSLSPESLREAYRQGIPATSVLSNLQNNSQITFVAQGFAFFAITTSFIGVSLSLKDFLTDGLKGKVHKKSIKLLFLIYGPPLIFVIFYPRAFLIALDFAGRFGALLLGIWPLLMVYKKRQMKLKSSYRVPGGTFTLIALFFIYAAVIFIGFIKG